MQSLTLPTSALVAGALLLDAPVDRRSALGRLGAPDLEALDHDGLIHDGRLVPWFATLVEVVAWPELAAELVRRHAGSAPARTLVWARADAAVLGRPNAGTITVASIAVGAMAEHLVEASAVPERSPDLAHPLLVGELLAALLADDAPGVTAALDRAAGIDSPDLPLVADALTVAPTTWRLETAWTDRDGPRGGVIGGLHAGALGTWEIRGTAHPLDLRPTTSSVVRRRVAHLLPCGATGVADESPLPAHRPEEHL